MIQIVDSPSEYILSFSICTLKSEVYHVFTLYVIVNFTFSWFRHFLHALTHSSKTVRSTILGVHDLEGIPEPPVHKYENIKSTESR